MKKSCNDTKCPDDKICNPDTIRCVLLSGVIGKSILKSLETARAARDALRSKRESKRSRKTPRVKRDKPTCSKKNQKLVNGNCECVNKLQIFNDLTKNCVSHTGIIGKSILAGTNCPKGEVYNKVSKKCEPKGSVGKSKVCASPKLPGIVVSPSATLKYVDFKPSTRSCITNSITKLAPYQAMTVDYFTKSVDTLLVVFETGMGKTLTAVAAAECHLRKHPNDKVIIITLKSLVGTFQKEFEKYGNVHEEDYEVYTYDTILIKEKKGEAISGKNALVIFDEVHTLRNYYSQKFYACMNIVKKSNKVLLLTATPYVNGVCDFIPIINLLNKKYVIAPNHKESSEHDPEVPILYAQPKYSITGCTLANSQPLKMHLAIEMIKGLLTNKVSYAQKTTGVGTDYPTVHVHDEMIRMDKAFEEKFKEAIATDSDIFAAPDAFANGYRRAVNSLGPGYFSKKLDRAISIIKKDTSKYAKNLIFSNWIEYGVDTIKHSLETAGISYGLITGSTSTKDRQSIVAKFNHLGGMNTLIISGAGSTGLDLKGVQNIIVLDPVWNNAILDQIKGRGVRYKSHEHLPPAYRNVNIYLLKLVERSFIDSGDDGGSTSGDYLLYKIIESKTKSEKVISDMLKEVSVIHKFAGYLNHYE
jgi:superfamily II DNA or RNA helicase